MITSTMTDHQYDVCLSFAGEQRSYVEEVARRLREECIRVFYDEYEKVELWGKDLYEHLDWVYQKAARYCVLFVSADYARKIWATHERRSAQARALRESEAYVLPVRFDDTEIPGLRPTTAYIDLRETTPEALAQLIVKKLDAEPRRLHVHSWPAAYSGLVWIWIRPLPRHAGEEHDIRLRWGPWHRRVTTALSESGLTLITGKSSEDVAVPCQVEVTPPVRVSFGVGEVPDRPALDIAAGWTTKPTW